MKDISIHECQKRLLEMARIICDILTKNDIPYMITFGTLLGAVRHKGFIPWDDDFDIFIFSDTYERAIELLKNNIPNDMFVEDKETEPLYFHAWAHVKDLNSEVICNEYEQDGIYSHHGFSIDLYKTVLMKETQIDLYRMKEELLYIERLNKLGIISKNNYKKRTEKLIENINNYKENVNNNKLAYGMCLKQRIMYPNEIFPLRLYRFEDCEFYGPNDYNSLLSRFYGKDYLIVPDKENRKTHYANVLYSI